ncbi:MAG: tyrosine-protein kinase Etk/Wzc [Patescibacteria group bacterium]|jgi:tyrosine-protein kinase Etk/Wzc
MDATKSNINGNPFADVNVKFILKKILRRKWLFILSLAIFIPLAYLYTKIAKPVYQCATTIMIEEETVTKIGGSKEFDFNPLKEEKNLNNEIALIRTHSMIKKSVAPLGFNINYYSGTWYGKKEKYGLFPFEVLLIDSSSQLYGAYFEVVPKSDTEFELLIEEDEFAVSDPKTNTTHDVEQEYKYQQTHKFGESIKTDYFHLVVQANGSTASKSAFADKQLFFKLKTLDGIANSFKGDLKVDQPDLSATVIRLQTEGPVPKKQLMFLEQLSKNYIKSKEDARRAYANSKKAVLEKAIAETTVSMKEAERNLESFQTRTKTFDIPVQTSDALEKISKLESEKQQFDLDVDYFNQVLLSLKDTGNIDAILSPAIVGIEDPLLNENLVQLKEYYSELTEKSQYLGEKNKDLRTLRDQIRSTTNQLKGSLSSLIDKSLLESRNRDSRIVELQQTVAVLPANDQLSLNLKRKYDLAVKKYEFLSNELSKTEIAEIEKIMDARILEPPRKKGDGPVAPQKQLIMLLGGMAGLLFPFLFIVLFDPYDEDLTEIKQLEKYSNLPIVGSVAHFSEKKGIFSGSSEDSRWQVEESFRDVCTNVQILLPDEDHNVIGVTSTVPNEGKTFCALNMAINLAASGKKVLLIDSDLRNSDLLQKMGVEKNKNLADRVVLANGSANEAKDIATQGGSWFEYNGQSVKVKGLLNYLSGEVQDLSKVIHSYKEEPTLKFIPANLIDGENPHRLLADKRFEVLIKEAKKEFDYVVIDSPPVGLVSDYLLISKFIDLHLIVVRRNVSKFSYLQGIEKVKRTGRLKKVLLLFNDAVGKSLKYGYSNYTYGQKVKK